MESKVKERWFFAIVSLMLIGFQGAIYCKLCRWPSIHDINLWFLLGALGFPFVLAKLKNKQLYGYLFSVYLIYCAIVAGAFLEALLNLNVNCTNTFYLDLKELS